MFDYSQARTHMLDSQILTNGIIDPNIIEAFNSTPREKYVTEGQGGIAYTDEDDIGNRTIDNLLFRTIIRLELGFNIISPIFFEFCEC